MNTIITIKKEKQKIAEWQLQVVEKNDSQQFYKIPYEIFFIKSPLKMKLRHLQTNKKLENALIADQTYRKY